MSAVQVQAYICLTVADPAHHVDKNPLIWNAIDTWMSVTRVGKSLNFMMYRLYYDDGIELCWSAQHKLIYTINIMKLSTRTNHREMLCSGLIG
jgi:hypothetical protein